MAFEYFILERRWEQRHPVDHRVGNAERMSVELTRLSKEGWELISIASGGNGYLCALRRPLKKAKRS